MNKNGNKAERPSWFNTSYKQKNVAHLPDTAPVP